MNHPTISETLIGTAGGDRRSFLRKLGLVTAGAGTFLAGSPAARAAEAQISDTDVQVLNFALNLEYLEAEFYLRATTGKGLGGNGFDIEGNGSGPAGKVIVKQNPKVSFASKAIEEYANEIAHDEARHVRFIRETLIAKNEKPVARPRIDLKNSFETLGNLIGVENFDPFANELNFLLGAFIFEDVGVTAYKGASPLLSNKRILEAAAGILGVEAYHAGIIRALLYSRGRAVRKLVGKISDLRDSLDGGKDRDQGIMRSGDANLVPTNNDAIAYSRTTRQVLNIVYGKADASKGLFFPKGLNGAIS